MEIRRSRRVDSSNAIASARQSLPGILDFGRRAIKHEAIYSMLFRQPKDSWNAIRSSDFRYAAFQLGSCIKSSMMNAPTFWLNAPPRPVSDSASLRFLDFIWRKSFFWIRPARCLPCVFWRSSKLEWIYSIPAWSSHLLFFNGIWPLIHSGPVARLLRKFALPRGRVGCPQGYSQILRSCSCVNFLKCSLGLHAFRAWIYMYAEMSIGRNQTSLFFCLNNLIPGNSKTRRVVI